MSDSRVGGWHPDPTGQFDVRYHDGAKWTMHVSKDGEQSTSPMPPYSPPQTPTPTGGDPRKPTAADKLRGRPWWQWAIAGFVLLIIIVALIPSNDTSSAKKTASDTPAAPETTTAAKPAHPTRVSGSFDKTCGGLLEKCDSNEAATKLNVDDVWCEWQGSQVIVHALVHNGMNAKVKFSIVPRYSIKDGGTHGQSSGSDRPITVPAKGQRVFRVDAGHPIGVPDGTPFASCKPKLQDASLSNGDTEASTSETQPAATRAAKVKPANCGTKATDDCTPHVGSAGHVRVDAIVYRILSARTAKTIGDPDLFGESADGRYVILKVRVLSLKDESATLTDVFKLDINGKTYDTSSGGTVAAMGTGGEPFFLKKLGPDAAASGLVVFDVPESKIGRKMELRLNELGFGSTHAFIKLPPFGG